MKISFNYKIIIGLVIVIILVGILTFNSVIQNSKKKDISLVKELSCEFREEVYLDDFVAKINGTLINNFKIDTSKVGTQTVSLVYKTTYGIKLRKEFDIEVKDVTNPTVVVSNPYTIEVGSVSNLVDSIFCADDYDDELDCKIVGEYDLNKIGKYDLEIVAVDHSDNSTSKKFTLNVIDKKKKPTTSSGTSSQKYTSFKEVYQKYKNDNTLIGLDLSKWQGDVDFSKLKEQDVSFVMLKVGGQTEIDGEFNIDPKFYDNIKKANEYGIKVGVYFYSYARTEKEAKKQANWIVSKIKDYDIDLPIVFDWENWSKYTTFHISFNTLNNVYKAFMEEVEDNGYEAMLYSSKYYLETIWYRDEYKVWLAYYTTNNTYDGEFMMWQLCNDGKIDGINGYVDIDVMYLRQN